MFTVLAIIFTIIFFILIRHGGKEMTWVSTIGGFAGIAAAVLWAVVSIALTYRLFAWLWVNAP